MKRCKIWDALVVVWFLLGSSENALSAKDICITTEGVQICVQPKGPCGLDQIIGGEKSKLKMEMFSVSISNRSGRKIKLLPENFYGVTEQGFAVVVDAPFFDSIELKNKLRRQYLMPNGVARGVLLLPSSMGRIRTIVYGGNPSFEIRLF